MTIDSKIKNWNNFSITTHLCCHIVDLAQCWPVVVATASLNLCWPTSTPGPLLQAQPLQRLQIFPAINLQLQRLNPWLSQQLAPSGTSNLLAHCCIPFLLIPAWGWTLSPFPALCSLDPQLLAVFVFGGLLCPLALGYGLSVQIKAQPQVLGSVSPYILFPPWPQPPSPGIKFFSTMSHKKDGIIFLWLVACFQLLPPMLCVFLGSPCSNSLLLGPGPHHKQSKKF